MKAITTFWAFAGIWLRVAAECRAAGKHLRSIHSQVTDQAREDLHEQLWQAWVWRDSKVLKKRAATGPKGSSSVTLVEWDDECPARPLEHRTDPEYKFEIPVILRSASCLPCFQKDLKAAILELKNHEADLEPRSFAQYRVQKGKLANSVPPWALPRVNPNSLDPDANTAPRLKDAALDLLGPTINCGRPAFLMNRSLGTYILKTNGHKDMVRETFTSSQRDEVRDGAAIRTGTEADARRSRISSLIENDLGSAVPGPKPRRHHGGSAVPRISRGSNTNDGPVVPKSHGMASLTAPMGPSGDAVLLDVGWRHGLRSRARDPSIYSKTDRRWTLRSDTGRKASRGSCLPKPSGSDDVFDNSASCHSETEQQRSNNLQLNNNDDVFGNSEPSSAAQPFTGYVGNKLRTSRSRNPTGPPTGRIAGGERGDDDYGVGFCSLPTVRGTPIGLTQRTVPFADTVPLADTVCYIHNAYDLTNLTKSEAHLGSASPAPDAMTPRQEPPSSTVPFADTVPIADTVYYIHTSSASEPAHLGSASPARNSQRNTFKRFLDRFLASQLCTVPSADTVTSNRL
jgi:hypothetical protein